MADTIDIAPFEATPLERIPEMCAHVADTFRTNVTKDVEWRKRQLRKLYWAAVDYTPQLCAALQRDLHKSAYEAEVSEIGFVKNDCLFMLSQLDRLAADERLGGADVPAMFALAGLRVRKEPLGAALIIGAYNYPVNLLVCPLIGAIAAGCPAVVKPSEGAPHTAMVLRAMLEASLDPDAYAVVNGGIPETTALLDFRDVGAGACDGDERGWAKIFYTGSRPVARIIAAKAAATLTPVTLELGGRNPAFVTAQADVALAARRLLWAKTFGGGQVCLSQNYVLVERSVLDAFVRGLQDAYRKTFPGGDARNSDLCRLPGARQYNRLTKLLADTRGRVVLGGDVDPDTFFISPTAVLVDSPSDPIVQQETFGPIFSILPVDSLADAVRIANEIDPTPLSLYSFGSPAENKQVLGQLTSGGATLNDGYMHSSANTVPFGGVGQSGTGSYRGRASFETFTHRRTVAQTPSWMESLLRMRYMPYDWSQLRMVRMLEPKPNFDRSGNVNKGLAYWLRLVVGLGSRSAQEPKSKTTTNGATTNGTTTNRTNGASHANGSS